MYIKLEDLIPGGKADAAPKKGVNKYELEKGIKVEMEHTNSKAKAEEIARDHLAEDPKYYTKLKKAGLADELTEKDADIEAELIKKYGNEKSKSLADKNAELKKKYGGKAKSLANMHSDLRKKYDESNVGDLYIQIGETVEEMESSFTKLTGLFRNTGDYTFIPILNDLKKSIIKLKNKLGESYDFGGK